MYIGNYASLHVYAIMQDQLLPGQQGQLFSYKRSVKDGSVWRVTLLPGTALFHINGAYVIVFERTSCVTSDMYFYPMNKDVIIVVVIIIIKLYRCVFQSFYSVLLFELIRNWDILFGRLLYIVLPSFFPFSFWCPRQFNLGDPAVFSSRFNLFRTATNFAPCHFYPFVYIFALGKLFLPSHLRFYIRGKGL